MKSQNPKQLSAQTLAFLGDSVYELLVRRYVVQCAEKPVKKLHEQKVHFVCAESQAALYDYILPLLSEEEHDIIKRGRNANGASVPKNADVLCYRKATGVETLFGYLYLSGRTQRAEELFQMALELEEQKGVEK